jgi:EmrB/QacA subfamily drug resistance transporter
MSSTAVRPADASAPAGSMRPGVVLAIVLSATFMQLVDISIVNTAIPSIQRELSASYAAIQLVLVCYQLAFACTLITAARLGDIYGRRRLFLIGMVGFTLASALCGAAPNPTILVLSRLLQGFMSGLMFPQVLAVIQVTFAPRERGRAFGILGAVIGLATILGPLLGGVLIQLNLAGLSWRTIFYVNLPVGIVSLAAAVRFLPESHAPNADRLDLPGVALITAGLLLLVYPLAEGRDRGWPAWLIVMLAASVPLLVAFTAYERAKTRREDSPLVWMDLFSDRAFRVGLLLSMVFFAGLPTFFFTFTLYLQIGLGYTALGAGLTGFSFAVGSGLASSRSDKLARRLGNGALKVGTALLAVGMALVLLTVRLVGVHPHGYQFVPALLVAGMGLGFFIAPVTNIILAGIHSRAAGSASGVLSTAQQIGGAVGIAVVGVIFFTLIGANAGSSSNRVTPELRRELSALPLPAPAVNAIVAGFARCFDDRAHEKDPSRQPASCRMVAPPGAPAGTGARITELIQGKAAPAALARTFSTSFQEVLLYEIAVFLLAFGVVFALPTVNPAVLGGRGGPEPA